MIKLETKDLVLKKAEFTDWKAIYKNLWMHEESARYMLWTPTKTEEDAKARMFRTIEFEKKPENKYLFLVNAFSGSYFPKPCAASARTKKSHRHAAVGATDPFQTVENNGQYLMNK